VRERLEEIRAFSQMGFEIGLEMGFKVSFKGGEGMLWLI